MALVEVDVRRVDTRAFVGATKRQLLASRVGGCDSLTLAVAGRPDATNHRVDPIPVSLGIAEALEHHDSCAFPHHEAIRSLVKGGRVVR